MLLVKIYEWSLFMRLSDYFKKNIGHLLPDEKTMIVYWEHLKEYVACNDNIIIIRKFGEYKLRGNLYNHKRRDFTVSDNEPALWIYHRCLGKENAIDVFNIIKKKEIPIAFALTKSEKKGYIWNKIGRVDKSFSKDGWKHCHILQCSPRNTNFTNLSLEQRCYRLLSPLNHFPFPSPRFYKLTKDWGEDEGVLNWILWYLYNKHYSDMGKEVFKEFIDMSGGTIPKEEPEDIEIDFDELQTKKDMQFYDSLDKIKENNSLTDTYYSSDESIYSFDKGIEFQSLEELIAVLKGWLEHTDEETISNSPVGVTPWIFVTINDVGCKINSDTTRSGIIEFIDNYEKRLPLKVICSTHSGKINVATNSPESKKIKGLHFYTLKNFEEEFVIIKKQKISSTSFEPRLIDDHSGLWNGDELEDFSPILDAIQETIEKK